MKCKCARPVCSPRSKPLNASFFSALILASAFSLPFTPSASAVSAADRQCLAIDVRDNNRIYLSTTHPSGVVDNANARQNIVDTANGLQAKRSSYGTAPGGSVWLDPRMLNCMAKLEEVYGYSYSVSEIAGASHSSGSYHYYGTAFDVYVINGSGVSSSNPYWASYNQRCRDMGSIESLGPGYPGHDTHVHNAWGTGSGINVAPPPGSGNCSGSLAGPDAVSWGPNRIDVVARGADNAIYRRVYTGSTGWNSFNSIGGNASSGPSIASWGSGRLDIFYRGTDNSLMHRAMTPEGWQPWHSLGQNLEAAPDAVSWGQGRIDVVARGSGNNILHRAYHDNNWDGWQNMGGGDVASSPSICSWAGGRLDVFYRSANNELKHQGYNGSWLGWQNLGGNIRGGPDAVSWGPGRIDVVVRGPNNDILHRAFHNGAWDSWQNLGGNSASDPTICSWDSGRLDVFYVSPAGELWHRAYNSSGWQSWQNMGGNLK